MDENSKLLDELARDAERAPGDAKKAWRLLAAHIDETDLPTWVKTYVQNSAAVVADYDIEEGDQAMLAHMLGFYREVEERSVGYDYDHLFDWFVDRMTTEASKNHDYKPNISELSRVYHEEVMKMNGSPGAIRKAYEKARARHAKRMESETELERLLAERGV